MGRDGLHALQRDGGWFHTTGGNGRVIYCVLISQYNFATYLEMLFYANTNDATQLKSFLIFQGVRRMASRGHKRSPLPSVTSHSNDNKPDSRGAAPLYLDFEGNIHPSDSKECLSAGGVTGRDVWPPEDTAKPLEGSGEAVSVKDDADPTVKYNSFNYWRRRLPNVTSELKDRNSRRPDVNGNSRSLSVIRDNKVSSTKQDRENIQVSQRFQSRSLSPKPGRSRPGILVLHDREVGESSTDQKPNAETTPFNGHYLDLALRRDVHLEGDDYAGEDQLHLDYRRLKSGSFCDYSRYSYCSAS